VTTVVFRPCPLEFFWLLLVVIWREINITHFLLLTFTVSCCDSGSDSDSDSGSGSERLAVTVGVPVTAE
jgi:hypothetical protein